MEPLRGEAWWKEVRALGDAHEEDTGAQTPPVFTSVMSEGQHPPPHRDSLCSQQSEATG